MLRCLGGVVGCGWLDDVFVGVVWCGVSDEAGCRVKWLVWSFQVV